MTINDFALDVATELALVTGHYEIDPATILLIIQLLAAAFKWCQSRQFATASRRPGWLQRLTVKRAIRRAGVDPKRADEYLEALLAARAKRSDQEIEDLFQKLKEDAR